MKIAVADNSIILVDARYGQDFQNGHLPGAISVSPDMDQEQILAALKPALDAKEIVVYCSSPECKLADEAASIIREVVGRGSSICVYDGGWEEWSRLNKH